MNRHHHHHGIKTCLATAVTIATSVGLAASASASRMIEPTLPAAHGSTPIRHVHILRVSGATATSPLSGAALNPMSRLGPGAVDVG
jgi:hypothetical protein